VPITAEQQVLLRKHVVVLAGAIIIRGIFLAVLIHFYHLTPTVVVIVFFGLGWRCEIALYCLGRHWCVLGTLHSLSSLRGGLRCPCSRSSRVVINSKSGVLSQLVKHCLLIHIELCAWAQRDKGLPDVETKTEIGVGEDVLIADTGAGVTRRVLMEGVPFLNRGHLEPLEESCADQHCQRDDHCEELGLCRIHVAVHVEQEGYVD